MSDILIQLGRLALARDDQYQGDWHKTTALPDDDASGEAWAEYGQQLSEEIRRDKARTEALLQLSGFVRANRAAIEEAVK